MFKNYYEARDWLENFIPFTYSKEELGLEKISHLLGKLGNPQNKFRSIHIGGTSGKGTTAFYLASLLAQVKKSKTQNPKPKTQNKIPDTKYLKIGLHISPHLVFIGERMQILESEKGKVKRGKYLGNEIPVRRLMELVNEIKPAVEAIAVKQPQLTPSYFEILVALSFLYFAQEKVDWAVVEVGLGGRLDATNVLKPKVSVITNIGLDHIEILGNTIEKIAKEKAGIIKNTISNLQTPKSKLNKKKIGMTVVTGAVGNALKVIEKTVKSKNAQMINLFTQNGKINPEIKNILAQKLQFDIFSHSLYSAQAECILLAILTVLQLEVNVSEAMFAKTVKSNFAGRFEQIDKNIILDGAHNVEKINALLNFVNSKFQTPNSKREVMLVLAFKKGKDWQKMIDLLISNLPIKEIIATQYQAVTDMGRGSAVDAKEIAKYVAKVHSVKCKVISNSPEAVIEAINQGLTLSETLQGQTLITLITGSLYLVGEARTLWKLPPVA